MPGKVLRNAVALEVQRCTGIPFVAVVCPTCKRRGFWRTRRTFFEATCCCGATFKVAAV